MGHGTWCVELRTHVSPVRGENGLKHDAFIDLDFGDKATLKPVVTEQHFNNTKLFLNETDGSSFPNGGLSATHTVAAFAVWDRSSPPFVRGDICTSRLL